MNTRQKLGGWIVGTGGQLNHTLDVFYNVLIRTLPQIHAVISHHLPIQ